MQIYLPIAEMSVNVFVVLALGGGVGLLSGLFGVGGGFLITPLLVFLGVPAPVAVGTGANEIVATSVSGVVTQLRRGNVDLRMGTVLTIGGFLGSGLGVWLFSILKEVGQIDLVIGLCYVIFLSIIGGLMAWESLPGTIKQRATTAAPLPQTRAGRHTWIHGLPFKMRFHKSKLYISAIVPLGLGFLVGILAALMGVGGGFVMVPAMIYILGMPTTVAIGTSLFQIIFVTANTTFLQAVVNNTVDVVLALLLLIGGVIGAQIGTRLAMKLRNEQLRLLLALLVLGMAVQLGVDLVRTPADVFSFTGGER
ncbi:MAG: sulfite exporter TauE/SafE family protein [Rhodospirillaceae bacterium]|nr:sulfite exporter TauE/SafE family protein [Rhodospirillaceae bacterium]